MSSARTHIAERQSSVASQQHIEDDKTSTSICNEARRFILYVYLVSAKTADPVNSQLFLTDPRIFEPRNEISNNRVCATSKGSDQPAHRRSLIRAFVCRLNILLPLS